MPGLMILIHPMQPLSDLGIVSAADTSYAGTASIARAAATDFWPPCFSICIAAACGRVLAVGGCGAI